MDALLKFITLFFNQKTMKKSNKFLTITGVLGALAIMGIAGGTAFADSQNGKTANGQRPDKAVVEQRMQDIKQAIENNDYNTWHELVTENGRSPNIADVVTEDNFYLLAELEKARQDKDFEKANEIANQLGIKPGMMMGAAVGPHRGEMKEGFKNGDSAEVKAFIENNDYQGWYDLYDQRRKESQNP